jgi:hypothetical protein
METQNEEEFILEENIDQVHPREHRKNSEGILGTQVLETMRNLIVELQAFKADNEKLKKAHEDQQEINEVFLRSIVTKKIPKDNEKDEEVSKIASKKSSETRTVLLKAHQQKKIKQP